MFQILAEVIEIYHKISVFIVSKLDFLFKPETIYIYYLFVWLTIIISLFFLFKQHIIKKIDKWDMFIIFVLFILSFIYGIQKYDFLYPEEQPQYIMQYCMYSLGSKFFNMLKICHYDVFGSGHSGLFSFLVSIFYRIFQPHIIIPIILSNIFFSLIIVIIYLIFRLNFLHLPRIYVLIIIFFFFIFQKFIYTVIRPDKDPLLAFLFGVVFLYTKYILESPSKYDIFAYSFLVNALADSMTIYAFIIPIFALSILFNKQSSQLKVRNLIIFAIINILFYPYKMFLFNLKVRDLIFEHFSFTFVFFMFLKSFYKNCMNSNPLYALLSLFMIIYLFYHLISLFREVVLRKHLKVSRKQVLKKKQNLHEKNKELYYLTFILILSLFVLIVAVFLPTPSYAIIYEGNTIKELIVAFHIINRLTFPLFLFNFILVFDLLQKISLKIKNNGKLISLIFLVFIVGILSFFSLKAKSFYEVPSTNFNFIFVSNIFRKIDQFLSQNLFNYKTIIILSPHIYSDFYNARFIIYSRNFVNYFQSHKSDVLFISRDMSFEYYKKLLNYLNNFNCSHVLLIIHCFPDYKPYENSFDLMKLKEQILEEKENFKTHPLFNKYYYEILNLVISKLNQCNYSIENRVTTPLYVFFDVIPNK